MLSPSFLVMQFKFKTVEQIIVKHEAKISTGVCKNNNSDSNTTYTKDFNSYLKSPAEKKASMKEKPSFPF